MPRLLLSLNPLPFFAGVGLFETVFLMDGMDGPPPLRPLPRPVPQVPLLQGVQVLQAGQARGQATQAFQPSPAVVSLPPPPASQRQECPQCGRTYNHFQSLRRHMKLECGQKVGTFQCPVCGHRSRRKSHLEDHMLRRHGAGSARRRPRAGGVGR